MIEHRHPAEVGVQGGHIAALVYGDIHIGGILQNVVGLAQFQIPVILVGQDVEAVGVEFLDFIGELGAQGGFVGHRVQVSFGIQGEVFKGNRHVPFHAVDLILVEYLLPEIIRQQEGGGLHRVAADKGQKGEIILGGKHAGAHIDARNQHIEIAVFVQLHLGGGEGDALIDKLGVRPENLPDDGPLRVGDEHPLPFRIRHVIGLVVPLPVHVQAGNPHQEGFRPLLGKAQGGQVMQFPVIDVDPPHVRIQDVDKPVLVDEQIGGIPVGALFRLITACLPHAGVPVRRRHGLVLAIVLIG